MEFFYQILIFPLLRASQGPTALLGSSTYRSSYGGAHVARTSELSERRGRVLTDTQQEKY
jgi:hypothetical protein